MASATLESAETIKVEEWINQANNILKRKVRHLSDERQQELKSQLENLLVAGEKHIETSMSVCLHFPSLLFRLGLVCAKRGEWEAAAKNMKLAQQLADKAVGMLRLTKPFELVPNAKKLEQTFEAQATVNLGMNFVEIGAWQQGLGELQKALNQFQVIKDTVGRAVASLAIGTVHQKFGDYEIAKSYYWDAVRLFRREDIKSGEASAQLLYGIALTDLQKYKEAEPHLLSARDLFAEAASKEQAATADRWLDLVARMEQSVSEKL